MKIEKTNWFNIEKTSETLAFFGKARLLRRHDGKHELSGGTADERATAREWCLLFAPEVVFADSPKREIAFAS